MAQSSAIAQDQFKAYTYYGSPASYNAKQKERKVKRLATKKKVRIEQIDSVVSRLLGNI